MMMMWIVLLKGTRDTERSWLGDSASKESWIGMRRDFKDLYFLEVRTDRFFDDDMVDGSNGIFYADCEYHETKI